MAVDTAWVAAPEQFYRLLTRLPNEQPNGQESCPALIPVVPEVAETREIPRGAQNGGAQLARQLLSHVAQLFELALQLGRLLLQLVLGASGGIIPSSTPDARLGAGCASA